MLPTDLVNPTRAIRKGADIRTHPVEHGTVKIRQWSARFNIDTSAGFNGTTTLTEHCDWQVGMPV